MRSTLVLALLGAFLLVLSGCGDTVIDGTKTEEQLKDSLERSLHEKIKAVDCPSDVKVEVGKTFTCAVDLSKGEGATATLKIRTDDADVSILDLKANKASAPGGASE